MKDTLDIPIENQDSLRNFPDLPSEIHGPLYVVFMLIKIRGVDKVSKQFPHEAQDFEPLVYVLSILSLSTSAKWDINVIKSHWETNYVFMIWLSMILMMPFT